MGPGLETTEHHGNSVGKDSEPIWRLNRVLLRIPRLLHPFPCLSSDSRRHCLLFPSAVFAHLLHPHFHLVHQLRRVVARPRAHSLSPLRYPRIVPSREETRSVQTRDAVVGARAAHYREYSRHPTLRWRAVRHVDGNLHL